MNLWERVRRGLVAHLPRARNQQSRGVLLDSGEDRLQRCRRHIGRVQRALIHRREECHVLRHAAPLRLRAEPDWGRYADAHERRARGQQGSEEQVPWYTFHLVAYIICEPCVGTKDTACVDVCPVDCIHPRKDEPQFQSADMLYIHPDECIDCGACVPACPVEAIFALDETPEKWSRFIAVNAEFFQKA